MHEVIAIGKAAEIAAIEAALVALRRAQRRRALAGLSRRRGRRASGIHAGLPDAVFELLDVLAAASERRESLTVTDVAAQLDVDQPRASRLAALALEAILIRREADQRDGRRSLLRLTTDGEEALNRIHDFRRDTIAEVTNGWSDEDRAALARLLPRFVQDFSVLTAVDR